MALIPPHYLDCVVALGSKASDEMINWIGTGFLFGQFIKKYNQKARAYGLFLVTNRHVIQDAKNLWIRINSIEGQGDCKDFSLPVLSDSPQPAWIVHNDDTIDVAVLRIRHETLIRDNLNLSFFRSDEHVLEAASFSENGVTEGDGVFVLGFPMGLVTDRRQCVICRNGCIARIRDLIDGRGKDFLVDSTVFPGNSGGPVILRPQTMAIEGTKSIEEAVLIGIVQSYVPYQDIAISAQTNRPRIVFEENTGLTSVIPVDRIIETINLALK